MREFSYILIASVLFLLLSSDSCNSSRQDTSVVRETELSKTASDLKNEFESDELSEKSLKAFEIKAKQKLIDFSDYLNVYTVNPIDESFKLQAYQMIQDLFISKNALISDQLLNAANSKSIPVGDFLNEKYGFDSMKLKFDSIRILEPLHKTDGMKYAGSLQFYRFIQAKTMTDTLIIAPSKMEVEIFVSKVKKVFGNDTLQIWNVSLGNLK